MLAVNQRVSSSYLHLATWQARPPRAGGGEVGWRGRAGSWSAIVVSRSSGVLCGRYVTAEVDGDC